jgi:septum formation protein
VKSGVMPKGDSVILASASKIRSEMLLHAGIDCDVVPAEIDEGAIKQQFPQNGSEAVALVLAKRKALHVSQNHSGRLVIGADQILDLNGEIFNKPIDRDQARSQLIRLSGRSHELISAVSVACNGQECWSHVDRARLWVRDLSREFIDSYLSRLGDAAFTSPGSYQVEGIGIQLFDRIDGNHYTILGMPLLPLLTYLRTQQMIPS